MRRNIESAWGDGVPEVPWSGIVSRGIAAILLGLLVLLWPGISLFVLIILFGVFALIDGIASIYSAVATPEGRKHWWSLLIVGLIGIAAAIITFTYPGLTLLTLLYIIATWAIITGVLHIIAALTGRAVYISNRWLWALSGALSILFGILLFAAPVVGLLTVAWLMGFYFLALGFTEIVLGLEFRGFKTGYRAAAQH